MKRKRGSAGLQAAQQIRLAWWAAFFATAALIAILSFARSAQAITLPVTGTALPAATELEDEGEAEDGEEDSEFDECEFDEEFEAEECEEEGSDEEEGEAPRQCLLSSATATVATSVKSNKVRLEVRYTAYSPGSVRVVAWLRGAKGPLSLGSERTRVDKQGVIRATDTLGKAQMKKALAATSFTIQLRPTHAPQFCNSLLDRHLTVRHNTAGRLTWSDPGPAATAARR